MLVEFITVQLALVHFVPGTFNGVPTGVESGSVSDI